MLYRAHLHPRCMLKTINSRTEYKCGDYNAGMARSRAVRNRAGGAEGTRQLCGNRSQLRNLLASCCTRRTALQACRMLL